jgi:hypothetical protein
MGLGKSRCACSLDAKSGRHKDDGRWALAPPSNMSVGENFEEQYGKQLIEKAIVDGPWLHLEAPVHQDGDGNAKNSNFIADIRV